MNQSNFTTEKIMQCTHDMFEVVGHRNVDNYIQLSVKTVRTSMFGKNACCINLQLPILFFVKSISSDLHYYNTGNCLRGKMYKGKVSWEGGGGNVRGK